MMVAGLWLLAALQVPDSVLAAAGRAAAALNDTGAARGQGFGPLAVGRIADLTPFQGQHWLHRWRVFGGSPDLATPSFVMFVPINGTWRIAGLAYSRRISRDSVVPTKLGGVSTPWHLHQPCDVVPGEGAAITDGESDCRARGGFPRPPEIAMVHAWTGVANPEGPYAHDNVALPYWVTGLKLPRSTDLATPRRARQTRALGLALAETYDARLPYCRLVEVIASTPALRDSLAADRARLRELVPRLAAAERARDQARWTVVANQAIRVEESLLDRYAAAAPSPAIRAQLELERALALGEMAHHHH
jgi:hypothetical protein